MKGTFSEIISVFYLYVVLVCKPGQLSRQHYQIYVIFVLRNLKSVREDNSAKMLFFPEIKKGKVERCQSPDPIKCRANLSTIVDCFFS